MWGEGNARTYPAINDWVSPPSSLMGGSESADIGPKAIQNGQLKFNGSQNVP